MHKKIILAFVFLATVLYSGEIDGDYMRLAPKMEQGKNDRALASKSDYVEFEKTLKQLVAAGDFSKAVVLGALYEQEFKFKNGETVKQNIPEAIKMYKIAANKGVGLALFKCGIYSLGANKTNEALDYFERATTTKNKEVAPSAAVAYAATILDKSPTNIKLLLKASDILRPYSQKKELPTGSFLMAHILLALGESSAADNYLTIACKNPNAPKEIKEFCFGSDVQITNNGKPLEKAKCPTCNAK